MRKERAEPVVERRRESSQQEIGAREKIQRTMGERKEDVISRSLSNEEVSSQAEGEKLGSEDVWLC